MSEDVEVPPEGLIEIAEAFRATAIRFNLCRVMEGAVERFGTRGDEPWRRLFVEHAMRSAYEAPSLFDPAGEDTESDQS